MTTLQGTKICSLKALLKKMIFLFPRWGMLVPWRVVTSDKNTTINCFTGLDRYEEHTNRTWKNSQKQFQEEAKQTYSQTKQHI